MARSLNSQCDFENGFFSCDRRCYASNLKSQNKNRKPHTGRGYSKAGREIPPMEETIQRRETISLKTSRSFNSQEK